MVFSIKIVYVFLLFVHIFLSLSMYTYCYLCILRRATLTEVFPCFFFGCKPNARHGPHSSKIVVLFYVLFVSYRSMYCLCVNVYCTTATG